MKRIKFVWDENGQVQAVEDPTGKWRLHEPLQDGQPCANPYCRFHIRTACEVCGRVNMRSKR